MSNNTLRDDINIKVGGLCKGETIVLSHLKNVRVIAERSGTGNVVRFVREFLGKQNVVVNKKVFSTIKWSEINV